MKVKPCNFKLLGLYVKLLSSFFTLESFTLIFFEIEKKYKWVAFLVNIVFMLLIYLGCLIFANLKTLKKVKIGNTRVIVKFGDLFAKKGVKVIAFNEFFDTKVDDKLISTNTLNGKVLKEKIIDIKAFDNALLKDSDCKKNIVEQNVQRLAGKSIRYKLGTCFKYKDIIAVAFSRFDAQNHAFLNQEDYFYCLTNFWKELNLVYSGENVYIPLLGSGITRGCLFEKSSYQDLLNMLLVTLKYNNLSFASGITISIMLSEDMKDEISIFDI